MEDEEPAAGTPDGLAGGEADSAAKAAKTEDGIQGDSLASGQDSDETGGTIRVSFLAREEVLCREETVISPGTDRREVKNRLKRLLYRMLQEQTGRTLPGEP